MATGYLSPVALIVQYFTDQGIVASGYQINTYVAGTVSTPLITFTDSTLSVSNSNPIVLTSTGRYPNVSVWVPSGSVMKIVITDANGTVIPNGTIDNIPALNDLTNTPLFARTSGEIAAGVTPTNFGYPPGDVRRYGAVGDGSTDDATAFSNAILSNLLVYIPPSAPGYRLSAGIIIPQGVSIYGLAFQPSNPSTGVKLIFDLPVQICLTLGGSSANNGAASAKGFAVTRAAGSPPANSVGVLVQNTYGTTVEDILSVSHQVCFKILGDGTTKGIGTMINRLWTGAAYDAHVVIDTTPECRFNQCRFGLNGAGDHACLDYVRIQGGSATNAANGPNTIVFVSCQFNQGSTLVTNWVAFRNKTPASISDTTSWWFDSCYVESDTQGFFSDATWVSIGRVFMSNSLFNPSNTTFQFMALNSGTDVNDWHIDNCQINCQVQYTSATNHMNNFKMSNCTLSGAALFNGVGAISYITVLGVTFKAGLTLTGSFTTGSMVGGNLQSGALTFTASGVGLDLAPYNIGVSWTSGIAFGGSSTGITYATQAGVYRLCGRNVYVNYKLTLTSKGAQVGNATLTGLPFAINNVTPGMHGSGQITQASNFAGLTGAVQLDAQETTTTITIGQWGAAGITPITDANFTNTTTLNGAFGYFM